MKYAAKRIAMLLVTMVIVSLLEFVAVDLISGDPATAMLGTAATPEKVAALRAELGLDRPLLVRYGEWLAGFFTGNLGVSYSYGQPVWDLISSKVLVTLVLSLMSFVLIVAVSIPMGLRSAMGGGKLEGVRDGVHTVVNQLCMAVPPFFTGILLSWLFGTVLQFAASSLAIPRIAMTTRMLRGTIREELQKDDVRTAISRGNDRKGVLRRHVLKNSLVVTVTFLAQTMAEIVAGSIVVEQVFAIPGLGRMLVASISSRDYPTVQAIVVILAFWVVLAGTVADLINQRIDPRLRLGGRPV